MRGHEYASLAETFAGQTGVLPARQRMSRSAPAPPLILTFSPVTKIAVEAKENLRLKLLQFAAHDASARVGGGNDGETGLFQGSDAPHVTAGDIEGSVFDRVSLH